MPPVRIRAPRFLYWCQVIFWSLTCVLLPIQAVRLWSDSRMFALIALLGAALSASLLAYVLKGGLSVTADQQGLRRNSLRGRRLIPWAEVADIRPAPERPGRIVLRNQTSFELASGPMPGEDEVDQLHTWHRAALEPARPGDAPDETGSEAQ